MKPSKYLSVSLFLITCLTSAVVVNAQSDATIAATQDLTPNVPDGTPAVNVEDISLVKPLAYAGHDICLLVAPGSVDLKAALELKAPDYVVTSDQNLVAAYIKYLGHEGLREQLQQHAEQRHLGDWKLLIHAIIAKPATTSTVSVAAGVPAQS